MTRPGLLTHAAIGVIAVIAGTVGALAAPPGTFAWIAVVFATAALLHVGFRLGVRLARERWRQF